MKKLLISSVVALVPLALIVPTSVASHADTRAETASTIWAKDAQRDVRGTEGVPARLVRATDVSAVNYKVIPNRVTDDGGQQVVFAIRHGRSLLTGKYRHRAVTRFTSGKRFYKAVYGTAGQPSLEVRRDGKWVEPKSGYWLSGGSGGGETKFEVPLSYFKSGRLTNFRTTLFLDKTKVRDRIHKSHMVLVGPQKG